MPLLLLSLPVNPILIVDHSNISIRGFRATFRPDQPLLSSSKGFPTNAIHTWASMLEKLVRLTNPSRIIFVIDGQPLRRLKLFPSYKAGREAKPEALLKQIPVLKQIVQESGLEYCYDEGEEADDLIATMARRLSSEAPVLIASADKDFCQCVTPRISRIAPVNGGTWRHIGEAEVVADFGVQPSQFSRFLALMGDTGDNIPGIDGIAGGRAAKILAGAPSDEEIISRVAKMKKWGLDEAAMEFKFSFALTQSFDLEGVQVQRGTNPERAFATLDELECRRAARFLREMLDRKGPVEPTAAKPELVAPAQASDGQQMLF